MKIQQIKQFPFNFEQHYRKAYHLSVIQYLYTIIEKACHSPHNKFGHGIWRNHILLVVRYSKFLAQQLNVDEEVCEIAALLHDYAGILDYNLYENHHVESAKLAHEILTKLKYPHDKIEAIKHCIISHRASKNIPQRTKEAKILASADAIAHILAYASLLDLAIYEYNLSDEQATEWVARKLERSSKKIMPEALPIIEEKYRLVKLGLWNSISLLNME